MSARILVIEDDEAILKFLRRGLAYEGYQVDVATEGQTDALPDFLFIAQSPHA